MPVGRLYVFFGEMSVKVFCPFFIAFFPVYGVTDLEHCGSVLLIFDSAESSLLCGVSSGCGEWGRSPVALRGFSLWRLPVLWSTGSRLLGASVVAVRGVSSCGSWAQLRRLSNSGMWA